MIDDIFSITGNDSDGSGGPDTGAQGCHFLYYPPPTNLLYLDGPSGGNNWVLPPSAVGPGGNDLYTNGYCTIHAASSPQVTLEPYVLTLTLDIEFPSSSSSSSNKHIYSITANNQGQQSNLGVWSYWGWWATQ